MFRTWNQKGRVRVIVTVPRMDITLGSTLDKWDSNMRIENNVYLIVRPLQAIWSLLYANVDLYNNLFVAFLHITKISVISNIKYFVFTSKIFIIIMLYFKQKKI